jgi:NAD-dependent SIR2 family protein deacetylase
MSGMSCSNCDEPMTSWDPLEPMWCDKCKMRANQISESARKEFTLFGEMLRKIRESKNEDNNGA